MDEVETEVVEKYNPFKSRKFLLVAFILVTNTLAYLLGRWLKIDFLSENSYIALVTMVFTGYITANVSQKAVTKTK
jgi:uncharacterized membrane protein YiaA